LTDEDRVRRTTLEAIYKKLTYVKKLLDDGWNVTFFDNIPTKEIIYYLTHPTGFVTRLAISWGDLQLMLKDYPEIDDQYQKLTKEESEIFRQKVKLLHVHLTRLTRRIE